MIFGRKKNPDDIPVDEIHEDEALDREQLAADELDAEPADLEADQQVADQSDDSAASDEDAASDPEHPKWDELDASQDWRADGPFDYEEVDLDADDIERLDMGTVIFTPFEGLNLQLQVDEQTHQVQAALAAYGNSAIEVSLFAAPAQTSMLAEIRRDMQLATEQAGGNLTMGEGPFGTELRRVIPLKDPEGNDAYHISRTWFAQGPRWLLRGVLMGEAAMQPGTDGVCEIFYEFFCNCVVRRDDQPRVPGDLIPMELPAGVVPAQQ